ncbi:MAG: 7-cyano-7-deazaguanine synthase QueC [Thermoplasmatota archaeon]
MVLLSGGIDSSTTLAIARSMGYECHALTLLYGQTHEKEIISAREVAASLGAAEHRVLELPSGMFSRSALTGDMEIPFDRNVDHPDGIPATYVPARNLIFLSIASGCAEVLDADAVFIGATAVDYSGYPDCRPEFMSSFEQTVNLATKRGVEGRPIRVIAPLLDMKKHQIISKGIELGLDLSLTWSCYSGGKKACGRCDSCLYRLKGFAEAGIDDPIEYEEWE